MVTASLCGRPRPTAPPNTNADATLPVQGNQDGTQMEQTGGAPGWMPVSPLRGSTEARIRLFCLRRRPLNSNSHWPASAFHGRKNSAPDTLPGLFCETRLFHWNADVAPLCRRKVATNGRRLLCAAADASSLLAHPQQRQPWAKRLPSPGTPSLAGAVFWQRLSLLRRSPRPSLRRLRHRLTAWLPARQKARPGRPQALPAQSHAGRLERSERTI